GSGERGFGVVCRTCYGGLSKINALVEDFSPFFTSTETPLPLPRTDKPGKWRQLRKEIVWNFSSHGKGYCWPLKRLVMTSTANSAMPTPAKPTSTVKKISKATTDMTLSLLTNYDGDESVASIITRAGRGSRNSSPFPLPSRFLSPRPLQLRGEPVLRWALRSNQRNCLPVPLAALQYRRPLQQAPIAVRVEGFVRPLIPGLRR